MKLSYNNQIKILNDIYIDLNSKFSQAYLSGSDWYIGKSLINNYKFVYPPDYSLLFYGYKKKYIEKSVIILNILTRFLFSKNVNIIEFIKIYNIDIDFEQNIKLYYQKKNYKNLILNY